MEHSKGVNEPKKKHFGRQRLKHFDYKGIFCYFLTICTYDKKPFFRSVKFVGTLKKILFEDSKKYRFDIICFCFMPDHLHILMQGIDISSDLGKFVKSFKQKTGYFFKQKTGMKLWQKSYYDHIIRKEEKIEEKCKYILENPARKGIVDDCRDYPFSWCKYFEVKSGGEVFL